MDNESSCFTENKKELKEAIRQLVLSTNPRVFGTAAFNSYASLERGRSTLGRAYGQIDRKILGPSFKNIPNEDRTFFIAFPERISTNLHYHFYIRPPAGKLDLFMKEAPRIWKKICPSGDLHLDLILFETDLRKGSYYITKDCFIERNFENFIISTEFCF